MIRVCRKHAISEFLRVSDMGKKRLAPNIGACSGLCLNREKTLSETGQRFHEKAENKILKIPDKKDEEYRRSGTGYDEELK